MASSPATTPLQISQRDPRTLAITWADGQESLYDVRQLRLACGCAECVDEWSREARLDPDTVPDDVTALDHMPIGKYAVQFLSSDAHYTGIYTFEYLRSVCQCISCKKNAKE